MPAGTVVAFHQAQWHAASVNRTKTPRRNAYISFCPTWMRPIDRDFPTVAELAEVNGASAEERWLRSEPRPPVRWFKLSDDDMSRLDRYKRDADSNGIDRDYVGKDIGRKDAKPILK